MDTQKIIYFPKSEKNNFTADDMAQFKQVGVHVIFLDKPERVFESMPVSAIPLSNDVVTHCLFEAVHYYKTSRDYFGQLILEHLNKTRTKPE